MMHKIILASILVSLLVLPNVTNFIILRADAAQVDYFLKIEGVPGESSDSKHKDWIDIQSYSFGATQTASSGGGGGAGKVKIQDLMITKTLDKSSPNLFLKCATGEHIKEVVITARKSGGNQQEFLKWKLTDVMISSYQVNGEGGIPTEQISLNFAKIEFEYKPQKADGTLDAPITGGWDVKANKKV